MQLSLLDALATRTSTPGVSERSERRAQRIQHVDLGDGAWLELCRGFVPAQAELFRLLEQGADWEQHERQMYERVVAVPRLVACCPGSEVRRLDGESVVRVLRHRGGPDEVRRGAALLHGFQAELSQRYARNLASISLAFYRDGRDSVAFHGDKLGALREDTVVAILSLGTPRHFLLRRAPGGDAALPASLLDAGIGVARGRGERRATFALSVGQGDLLVMGGSCQETWEHGVPKEPNVGPRIAVMFREAWDGGEGGIRNVRGVASTSRALFRTTGAPGLATSAGGSRVMDRAD